MRGLRNFITECLDTQTKEDEKGRVTKELANIKKNFGAKKMSGYDRKKYVAKLLYIHLLGYQFDFGYPQMTDLLTSSLFSEKQVGYITLGVLLNGNYELITMLIQYFLKEIGNIEHEPSQCLAISAVANIGGTDIAESLSAKIVQVLSNPKSGDFVVKKAALALCRLYRESPNSISVENDLIQSLINLVQRPSYGVQLSVASFIQVLISRNKEKFDFVSNCIKSIIKNLF